MNMPWGKHKGQDINSLPSDYLKWLAGECHDEDIAEAADLECQWREDFQEHFYD